ncbi:hypothetical protein PIIN_09849 [Serendipita indica DSM 11827]|uniref:Uncharacterized protein n=1 Tax=Serendipita indica (strain DSM 11827) TaxID=1109443 RepID=G4TX11_SERID|nr:hypothetical protein PIIN_09849 [Serendipita indica DSM 11827]
MNRSQDLPVEDSTDSLDTRPRKKLKPNPIDTSEIGRTLLCLDIQLQSDAPLDHSTNCHQLTAAALEALARQIAVDGTRPFPAELFLLFMMLTHASYELGNLPDTTSAAEEDIQMSDPPEEGEDLESLHLGRLRSDSMSSLSSGGTVRPSSATGDPQTENDSHSDGNLEPGQALLRGIIRAQPPHPNPHEAWFRSLGIPYHPHLYYIRSSKAQKAPKTNRPSTEASTVSGSDGGTLPPETLASSIGDDTITNGTQIDNTGKEANPSSRDGRRLTPSTATREILEGFQDWSFLPWGTTINEARDDSRKDVYKPSKHYPRAEPLHDITKPPMIAHGKNERELLIGRFLERHLVQEGPRLSPAPAKNEALRLSIAQEWRTPEQTPVPLFLVIPDQYREHLPFQAAPPAKETPANTINERSHSQSTAASQVDGNRSRVPVHKSEMLGSGNDRTSKQEERLMAELCQEYNISVPDLDEYEKKAITRRLFAKVAKMNAPWQFHAARERLRFTLHQYETPIARVVDYSHTGEEIERIDFEELRGNSTCNEGCPDLQYYPPFVIERFIVSPNTWLPVQTEMEVEKGVGGLLKGVFYADGVIATHNAVMTLPKRLKPFGSGPKPDLMLRLKTCENWKRQLCPVVFAAECKTTKTCTGDVRAQLALDLYASLIVLILFYLDQRQSEDEGLPPWMYLLGLEYTEDGVQVHAYYPSYDHKRSRWILRAMPLLAAHRNVFNNGGPGDRLHLLAVLYRCRSHSLFVADQLRRWERAMTVLGHLED